MKVSWDPLALAGVCWVIAALLYKFSNAHRWFGFFVAAGLVFAVAGVPYLLSLAHHPLGPGLAALIVGVGAIGGLLLFWFLVVKGQHKQPLIKRKGASGAGATGGGGGQSKQAPHHRAAAAFVLIAVFGFLAVTHWGALMQTGSGGISKTISGYTR